jgi:hypothetical protein
VSITVAQTLTAIGPGLTASFGASGGTGPYVYSVNPGGAGGSIDSSTGLYTAPAAVPSSAAHLYDTITATDSLLATGTAQILIGDPLLLFCDIIQTGLGLPAGRVYLWDQKIMQPTDNGLFVAVSVLSCKPFGNNNSHVGSSGGETSNQSVNMSAVLQVDIMSRDSSARTQKEAVLLALMSDYAQNQQAANGFYISKLPPGGQFNNISSPDGAAIPYRFVISVVLQYAYTASAAVPYMNPSASPTVNYAQS